MTKSLAEVFARASRLPADEQDALAAWLAEELESEERWGRLADEALEEHAAGGSVARDGG